MRNSQSKQYGTVTQNNMRNSQSILANFIRNFADKLIPFFTDEDFEQFQFECFKGGLREIESALLSCNAERSMSDSFVTFDSLFEASQSLSVLTTQTSISALDSHEKSSKSFRTKTLSAVPKTDSSLVLLADKFASQRLSFLSFYRKAKETVEEKKRPKLSMFLHKIEPVVECPVKFHKRFVVGTKSSPEPLLNWKVFVRAAKQVSFTDFMINWFALDSLTAVHESIGFSLSSICKDPQKASENIALLTPFVIHLWNKNGNFSAEQNDSFAQISAALNFYRQFIEAIQNDSQLKSLYLTFPLRKNLFETRNRHFMETLVVDFKKAIGLEEREQCHLIHSR